MVASASAQLTVAPGHYQIDKHLRLIICNELPTTISAGTKTIDLGKAFTFSTPPTTVKTGTAYSVSSNDTTYKLYFTRLPIIGIDTKNKAINDDEIGSLIDITDTTGNTYHSDIGVKFRGSYSRTFPKKSYRVQLWTDSTGNTTKDESLFGLRSDKRWLLLAMYNEKLRLNNKVSEDLWLKLHKLYYADKEPDAHSAIRTRYVEVVINGAYQGVYLFTEDMDRKQLKLKKQSTAGTGGELYKGDSWGAGTLFTGLDPLPTEVTELWSGWDLTYPDPDQTDWKNLYNFTDFAVNSPDSVFRKQISTKIREDNFADYFIFLNLLRAEDNTGKNLFLARYDEKSPYFIAPWDLDGTWGYFYDGTRKNVTDDVLTNNLFNRLLGTDDFKMQLATRWFALRANLLSIDSLTTAIQTNHSFLMNNGVYERENMVWAGDPLSYGQDELDYIQSWVRSRVSWLDGYFQALVSNKPIVYNFNAAALSTSSVRLNWSANCAAIQSFDVEASADSLTWHTLTPSSVLTNDSTACHYSFTDNESITSAIYYRLKVTDNNNAISYSPIQRIGIESFATAVQLYPNPVSTTLEIRGEVQQVRIYSVLGACVYDSDSLASNTIDVQQLATGLYVVHITQKDGSVSSHKVLVQR
ncbi:hypothetical protein GCM10028773_28580 [Spirosoma koreense]